MRFPLVVSFFVCLAVIGVPLFGQAPSGNINGFVADPSNAAVSGAEIVAANDITGVQYTTKTSPEGIYVLPNLPPGPYRIQVSKIGFKTLIKNDVVLNVQDSLSINFTLLVGAFHEIVTVQSGAPLLNTESATVSTVVDRQFAENLPMNGRSFQTLISLTPGVVVVAPTPTDTGQFSVNGQRASANYWMVDGVSANIGVGTGSFGNGLGGTAGSFSALGGTNSLVSVDAMQEFRIQTSTFAPEFGRSPGAQISIVTRSGTNRIHGSAFDYLRNDLFDAENWFNGYSNKPPLPKAKERQNDFGGTFSGPVLKDKTFYFFSYEGLRLRLPQTALTDVPDLEARSNAIPAMRPYLNSFPQPNGMDLGSGTAAFNASFSNPAMLDAYSLRLDHKLRSAWSFFGRYDHSPSKFASRGGSGSGALNDLSTSRITTQTMTLAATWIVSPTLINDLRFNLSHVNAQGLSSLDNFGGAVPLAIPPYPAPYNNSDAQFDFYIYSLGQGSYLALGTQAANIQRQLNIIDGVSWQRGTHQIKFGIDLRRLAPRFAPFEYNQFAAFNDVPSSEAGSNASGSITSGRDVTILFHNISSYVQDSWRARPRLTITYGARWDTDFAPSSAEGPSIPAVSGYNLQNLSTLSIAPNGTAPFSTSYGNFAPRFGIAYAISEGAWQTVVRGGAGVFYDLASAETGNLLGLQFPPFGNYGPSFVDNFPFTASETASPPIPSTGSLSNVYAFNPKLKLPYTVQWSAAMEQSLGKDQAVSFSYVGAAGKRLLQTTEFRDPPANPQVDLAYFIDNTAHSDYDALQVQFRRRLSSGFQAIASYAWSHSLDDASASSSGLSSNLGLPGNFDNNWGNSDFDVRNAFTAGLTYQLPDVRRDRIKNAFVNGWSIENFILARSAPPVDIVDLKFYSADLDSGGHANIRPDLLPGEPVYLFAGDYPGGKKLNPAAFADPPANAATGEPIRQGDLRRNQLRSFGATQWDFAVHREFPLRDSVKLQFRAEMFNLLNHPNFGPPYQLFGVSTFGLSQQTLNQALSYGTVGSGGFSPLYQLGGPRSVQLALKLMF